MAKSNDSAVRKVIENYMEGTFKADVETLKSCFHPNAVMNGYLGQDLLIGGPEPFFSDIGSNPSMESGGLPYRGEIISLEINKQVASVTLKEEGFPDGMSFLNYFHLIKESGNWKITSKTFTTL